MLKGHHKKIFSAVFFVFAAIVASGGAFYYWMQSAIPMPPTADPQIQSGSDAGIIPASASSSSTGIPSSASIPPAPASSSASVEASSAATLAPGQEKLSWNDALALIGECKAEEIFYAQACGANVALIRILGADRALSIASPPGQASLRDAALSASSTCGPVPVSQGMDQCVMPFNYLTGSQLSDVDSVFSPASALISWREGDSRFKITGAARGYANLDYSPGSAGPKQLGVITFRVSIASGGGVPTVKEIATDAEGGRIFIEPDVVHVAPESPGMEIVGFLENSTAGKYFFEAGSDSPEFFEVIVDRDGKTALVRD